MHEFAFRLGILAEAVEDAADDQSALSSGAQTLMFALGMMLMISLLTRVMIRAYRRSRRRSPRKDVKRVRVAADKQAARTDTPLIDAPASFGRWHSEMNDVARTVEAEVETKIGRLQATIRLADETASRLERAIQEARTLIRSDSPPTADESSNLDEGTLEQSEQILDSVRSLSNQTHRSVPKPHSARQQDIETKIVAMASEDATAREIAESTGLPVGDVELILSTRTGLASDND